MFQISSQSSWTRHFLNSKKIFHGEVKRNLRSLNHTYLISLKNSCSMNPPNVSSLNQRQILQRSFKNRTFLRFLSYIQGQSPENKVREYFYYIDHQGMLFLDDSKMKNFTSCFKDKKFLKFFFSRLRKNETSRYPEFPYISLCGRERNFIRCDDLPIVFTHVFEEENCEWFGYNHAGNFLKELFQPSKVYMAENGRIYHPADEKFGSIGLIQSKLAIEFSKLFIFKNDCEVPIQFQWNNQVYDLDSEWFKSIKRET